MVEMDDQAPPPPTKEFICHLKGLPWKCTKDQIIEFCGCDKDHIAEVVTVKDETGRFAGRCYIIVTVKESALIVIQKNKMNFGESGRWVEVKKTDRETMEDEVGNQFEWDGVVKLFGLPFQSNIQDVEDFLQGLTWQTDGIYFPISDRGSSTGHAFVQFDTVKSAEAALKRNRREIGGRYIEVLQSSNSEMRKSMIQEIKTKWEIKSRGEDKGRGGYGGLQLNPERAMPGRGGGGRDRDDRRDRDRDDRYGGRDDRDDRRGRDRYEDRDRDRRDDRRGGRDDRDERSRRDEAEREMIKRQEERDRQRQEEREMRREARRHDDRRDDRQDLEEAPKVYDRREARRAEEESARRDRSSRDDRKRERDREEEDSPAKRKREVVDENIPEGVTIIKKERDGREVRTSRRERDEDGERSRDRESRRRDRDDGHRSSRSHREERTKEEYNENSLGAAMQQHQERVKQEEPAEEGEDSDGDCPYPHTIALYGVPEDADAVAIQDFFRPHKAIAVNIGEEGEADVAFLRHDLAEKAMEYNNKKMLGCRIKMKMQSKPPKGERGESRSESRGRVEEQPRESSRGDRSRRRDDDYEENEEERAERRRRRREEREERRRHRE